MTESRKLVTLMTSNLNDNQSHHEPQAVSVALQLPILTRLKTKWARKNKLKNKKEKRSLSPWVHQVRTRIHFVRMLNLLRNDLILARKWTEIKRK